MSARKFKLLHIMDRMYYFWIMWDFDFHSCLVNQSVQLIRYVCGLDSRASDPRCLPWGPDQHRRPADTDQNPHQISRSCLSPGPQVSPQSLHPPSLLPRPRRPPSFPPHINYSLSPVAPAPPLPLWPRGLPSHGGQRWFSPLLPQTLLPQASLRRSPAGQHPHDPGPARGDRDPPVVVNNGLVRLLSSGWIIVLFCICSLYFGSSHPRILLYSYCIISYVCSLHWGKCPAGIVVQLLHLYCFCFHSCYISISTLHGASGTKTTSPGD